MAPAGRAAILLGIGTAHAATIHDISLRTHYTWGSHSEMTRKLLIAPSHMGAGARHDRRNAMRASAFDPPSIPPAFWERPDVCQALRKRDMGALFRLLCQYTGLSQMRIATAVGLGQGRISEVINGIRCIRDATVFERIADGLDMPDHARILLGLSPRADHGQHAPAQHHTGQARPGHRTAPPDHRGPQHRRHRRPRPAGRDRQHPAPGPPPRRPRRRRQARSPHQPHRRPASATPCAPATASSSPPSWPTPPPWPDGRPST